jgi:hypothetical protein
MIRATAKAAGGIAAFAAAVAAVLAYLGILGPNNPTPAPALAVAAERTTEAGSSKWHVETTVRRGSDEAVRTANGALDFVAEVGHLKYTDGSRLILQKPYAYVQGDTFGAPENVWCKHDLTRLGSAFLFGAITGFRSDPAAALVNLEENGTYDEVGTEQLFGVETTHYSGKVEFERLLELQRDPDLRQALEQLGEYNSVLPIEVWLDGGELPRQIYTTLSFGPVDLELTYVFSDFGTRVVAKSPPQSNTREAGTGGCPAILF